MGRPGDGIIRNRRDPRWGRCGMPLGRRRRWRKFARPPMGRIGEHAEQIYALRLPPPLSDCAVDRLRGDLLGLRLPDLRDADPWRGLRGGDLARFAFEAGPGLAAVPGTFQALEELDVGHNGARRGL